jgi:flagellar biosynthesis/type III secretory pathway protein FliH
VRFNLVVAGRMSLSSVQSLSSRLQVVYGSAPASEAATSPSFDEGYEAGRAEGLAEALRLSELQRLDQDIKFQEHLASLSLNIDARHSEWLASLEPALCGLAVAIAAKVIGQEVQQDPSVIESWVRQALAEVTSDCKATLRVSPSWAASCDGLDLVVDPTMSLGCVLETENGMIDARVDSMLAEALAALREAA